MFTNIIYEQKKGRNVTIMTTKFDEIYEKQDHSSLSKWPTWHHKPRFHPCKTAVRLICTLQKTRARMTTRDLALRSQGIDFFPAVIHFFFILITLEPNEDNQSVKTF